MFTAKRSSGLAALMLFAWAACASAQPAPAAQEYVPEVGQRGRDVVWVPSGLVVVNKMLDMVKLTPNDILYDLGSGDGRTVIAAARRGARAYGIEYNADLVALSRRNALKQGMSARATFEQGDIFQSDFSKATVVTLFLLPELNVRLRPLLLDMKPGTRIASNSFDMDDWKPDQVARVKGDCGSWCTAYLWIVPAKVAGAWTLADCELVLQQQYQMLTGTLMRAGKSLAIADGRMHGDRISFNAGGTRYRGRVSGDVIEGAHGSANAAWRAAR
ncbi:MAG: methyltransferase domain-containing protein [Betaproteobacteria bacterium]|nr:methyltransferase domain-containing protein [Betaproteobacteria bacterium]